MAAWGEQSRVYAVSEAWTTSTLHAGQFTAACGVLIYRGTALPERYRGAGFTCEPTGNLVHCELLTPSGATFTSRFRTRRRGVPGQHRRLVPTRQHRTGPDGALYVVDMYRAVI